MSRRMWDEKELIKIAEEHGSGEGAVKSVNEKTGDVVLKASDIKATNNQTIQANLENIDGRIDDLTSDEIIVGESVETGYEGSPITNAIAGLSERIDAKQDALEVGTGLDLVEGDLNIDFDVVQHTLTAGSNITIVDNVISASGSGGSVTPEDLVEILEGSDTVVVDINETDDKVQIKLDQDVVDDIGNLGTRLDAAELEIDGLTDDVSDLNTNKLNASKSAVATVGGLVIPNAAPTAHKLVGIDTTNAQELIGIGTNLSIENGVLNATGGGATYTAGDGIDITNNEISVDNTIARAADIPTATSDLTNDSGFITAADIPTPTNMVTIDTAQTITGAKTFSEKLVTTATVLDIGPANNITRLSRDTNSGVTIQTHTSYGNNGRYVFEHINGSNLGCFRPDTKTADLGNTTVSGRWNTLYCNNLSDGTTTKTMTEVLAGGTPSNMVTTNTTQTITGTKTFSGGLNATAIQASANISVPFVKLYTSPTTQSGNYIQFDSDVTDTQGHAYNKKLGIGAVTSANRTIELPNKDGTLAVTSQYTYQTTAPTSAITDGGIHIVYLTSEPTTKYNGYIYLIKE